MRVDLSRISAGLASQLAHSFAVIGHAACPCVRRMACKHVPVQAFVQGTESMYLGVIDA